MCGTKTEVVHRGTWERGMWVCCNCEDFSVAECAIEFFSKMFTEADVRIVMLRVQLGKVRFVTHHGIITLN